MANTIRVSEPAIQGIRSSGFDLESRILAVTFELIELYDRQISDKMDKMQAKIDLSNKYNLAMQELNKIKNTFNGKATSSTKIGNDTHKASLETALAEVDLEMVGTDGKAKGNFKDYTKGDIETMINKVQGKIDENNSASQMDQLQLQSLISKRNTQFEMASNIIKKVVDSLSNIISNMR